MVEGAVDVIGAFERVVVAGFQRLLTAGPADEVFGFGAGEAVCRWSVKRGSWGMWR